MDASSDYQSTVDIINSGGTVGDAMKPLLEGITLPGFMAEQVMYIMRGLPGSGKSYLADVLQLWLESEGRSVMVCSADDYFCREDGVYRFDKAQLGKAHAWCHGKAVAAMELGADVIVDNTNTQLWEMAPYLERARYYGAEVMGVLEPRTAWAKDVQACTIRNQHGVPQEAIQAMADRWEEYPA